MLVDIGKIAVRDRIRKDFGDIEELAKDIKENGLINPPVVTPDMELIAGERRLRAMKSLGYPQVEVRVMTVQDALHQLKLEISENENRKEFSFSEKMEWAERLKTEYSKIAEANQKANLINSSSVSSETLGRVDQKVAEEVGLGSYSKLHKAEYIKANADEEMIRQLDDGQLSVNAAYVKLKKKAVEVEAKLKEVEQERDTYAQEAVEAARAAKSATDSREYLNMADKLKAEQEHARNLYEENQRLKKGGKGDAEIEQAVTEATNKAKTEYRKLIDAQEKKIADLESRLAAEESPDISNQILRVHTSDSTQEQILNDFSMRIVDCIGSYLPVLRGLEVQTDLCSKLSDTTKALLRREIGEINQIHARLDAAIIGGTSITRDCVEEIA